MLIEGPHHVLILPGIVIVLFSGLNLRRYFAWWRSEATVVDVKPTIGEFIGDRVKVEYDFDQLRYVSNVGYGFCQNSRDVKVNDKVKILINPINANHCMLYDLQASLLSLIIGAVMIIVSRV